MLLIPVLGICFGFCLLVMKLDYSVALGAFLVGAVMAESRHIHRIERSIESLRDMFSAIFFVAIGLLFDPRVLVQYWLPITLITLAVVFGKLVSSGLGGFLAVHVMNAVAAVMAITVLKPMRAAHHSAVRDRLSAASR